MSELIVRTPMVTQRPTWDETWLEIACVISMRSLCSRSKVGAVVVTYDNKVNSVAYNGPAAGLEHSTPCSNWCPRAQPGAVTTANYDACPSVHAETNALLRADHSEIDGGTIYVSSSICVNCMKLICNSGLRRVVHLVRPGEEYREPEKSEQIARDAGLNVLRVTQGTV